MESWTLVLEEETQNGWQPARLQFEVDGDEVIPDEMVSIFSFDGAKGTATDVLEEDGDVDTFDVTFFSETGSDRVRVEDDDGGVLYFLRCGASVKETGTKVECHRQFDVPQRKTTLRVVSCRKIL